MAYVITDPCIGTKDTSCVDVCPVDCIHPRKDEPEFAEATMLYIDPAECIDCGACIPACPVGAIYAPDDVPQSQQGLVEANAIWYKDRAAAEAAVAAHQAANQKLMSLEPADRQAAHREKQQ